MKKPILVTRLSEDTLEVITDYQTIIHKAQSSGILDITSGEVKDGLVGSIWLCEGNLTNNYLTLSVTHHKTQEEPYEYSYKI